MIDVPKRPQLTTVIARFTATAVGPGTITVLVNGQPFPISLPAGIQLPASLVGQFVTLNLDLAQSGATATEGDDNESENDDQDDQGDNNQGDDD